MMAGSLKEAREYLAESTPNLVISDLLLPDGKGVELLTAEEEKPAFPLVLMTGHGDEQVAVEAIKAGALDYVVKSEVTLADMPHTAERAMREWNHIIEHKRAQEALRESEQKYRSLVESTEDSIYLVDRDCRYLFMNERHLSRFGLLIDSVIGRTYGEFHSQEEAKEFAERVKDVLETGRSLPYEYRSLRDSRYFIRTLSPVKEPDGKIVAVTVVSKDITERKHTEEALRESERRFRRLVEHATDAFFLHDFDGRIIDVNQHACESLGYTREELLGLSIQDIDQEFGPGKHLEKWEQLVPGKPITFEGVHRRKDGTTFPVEVHIRVLESGERQLMLALVRDISERKRAEEEKEKLEAQLQRAQKMEAIGTLAGGVAHDLNNILAGLVSYPELLLLEIPEDSPLRKPMLTIQKSGERAAAIVQDLLTLARRGVAATEVMDLNNIISEYLKSPEYERLKSFHPNVQFKTKLETDLLPIFGSPAHLSKIVMNLISNAAEAMPDGGEIFISTENGYIDRPIRGYDDVEEGDYVVLRVSDNGVGISKKDRERIFEPFYTKKAMGRSGTGLGMAVVWGAVKDHNGYIDIESAKGKGTTFTLYFPVTRKELPKDKSLVSIEDFMGKGESILVVDDVEEQREIASRILKKLGYSVASVSSGEEAVDYLKSNAADLLVLDMIMHPGIDGFETYKRILEFHPGQKAIIVSGFSETARVKKAQGLGAGAYVKKPFLLEKIGLAVREELGKM
jgi:PAS domain S-box-containing protein